MRLYISLILALLVAPAFADVPTLNGAAVQELTATDPAVLDNLDTSGAGLVFVDCTVNGTNVTGITSPSLTWTLRAETAGNGLSRWSAVSVGALVDEDITVDFNAEPSFIECAAYGIGNEDGFDANASNPDVGTTDVDGEISTDADDTLITFTTRGGGAGAVPTGWTEIYTAAFSQAYYKTFTSPQTDLAVPRPSGGAAVNGRIADAIAGPDTGPPPSSVVPILLLNSE